MVSNALLSSLIFTRFNPKSILALNGSRRGKMLKQYNFFFFFYINIMTAMTKTEKYFKDTTAADSDCLSSSSFNSLAEFNPPVSKSEPSSSAVLPSF